jgi:hypothetical protein
MDLPMIFPLDFFLVEARFFNNDIDLLFSGQSDRITFPENIAFGE